MGPDAPGAGEDDRVLASSGSVRPAVAECPPCAHPVAALPGPPGWEREAVWGVTEAEVPALLVPLSSRPAKEQPEQPQAPAAHPEGAVAQKASMPANSSQPRASRLPTSQPLFTGKNELLVPAP